MQGRLAVLKAYGQPFAMEEYDVPEPEPGALVVRVTQSAICGSDLHMWRGDTLLNAIPDGGRAMGHEGTGIVWKLGDGVTHDSLGYPVSAGDRIIHSVVVGCNSCHMCLRGDVNLCVRKVATPPAAIAPHFVGTFADFYYVRPGQQFFLVPRELSDDALAPVNCAMGTVMQGLISAGVGQGDSIVIQGAGGLGLAGTAMAKDMGVDRVIVVDLLENRLELAKAFGADHVINASELATADERIHAVRDFTRGRGADAVFEVVGAEALLPEGVAMLRPGGTFVDIGLWFAGRQIAFDPASIVLSGKRIMGSAMYRPSVLPRILDFLVRTKDTRPFDQLVSHRFALGDIDQAFHQSEWEHKSTPIVRAVLVP
ncbi:MAG TPA: zinc-binding dehydrogenase [Jatrophihabitantaceae bacterium]|jgi:threonine dehydrogenase-like Zn-dependent dehydrogenase|nr:zinc-binding dehydrogenase [Jatrophihabitantaceae bacterium]